MPSTHDGKENKPPPQSLFQAVFDWSSKPHTATKNDSKRTGTGTGALTPLDPNSNPAIGTFSSRVAPKHQPIGIWTPIPQAHMPYNNAAIPPSEEVTGSASLPLARVKRILALDEDIHQCSNNGAFVITVATEMFIRYLAEQALNVAKAERKPRRNIQYKDLGIPSSAVSRLDNLEFLSDVIPKTTTFREYKEKKSKGVKANKSLSTGQTTLDGARSLPSRPADVMHVGEALGEEDDISPDETGDEYIVEDGQETAPHTNGNVSSKHHESQEHLDRDGSQDVEMG
ncbi:MAG: hypothetical protein Q9186_003073 [Xanthomendoza sp. 1 TL-2023]